jgi:uncharacterized repeat protein (TIGR01451 family)
MNMNSDRPLPSIKAMTPPPPKPSWFSRWSSLRQRSLHLSGSRSNLIHQLRSPLKYIGSVVFMALIVSFAQAAQAAVTITRTSSPIFYMDDDNTPKLDGMYTSYQITNTGSAISNAWAKLDMPAYGAVGIKVTLAQYEDGLVQLGPMAAGETKTAFFYVYTPQAMPGANGSLPISESHTVRVYEGNPTLTGTQLSSSSFTFTEIRDTLSAAANKATKVTITTSIVGDLLTIQVLGDAGNIGNPPVQSFSPAVFADWPADALELQSSSVVYGATSFQNQLLFQFTATNTIYTATYLFRIRSSTNTTLSLSPVGEIASGNQIKHTDTGNFASLPTLPPISAPGSISIAGKVWDDANNSANNTFVNINTGSEVGTNAGGLLNAILVDSLGKVIATKPIAIDGTYTFTGISGSQNNVTIQLSTTAGTVGQTAPTASVPSGWIGTSPLAYPAFNLGTTNIVSKDFGIEQPPNTTDISALSQTNPGGTTTVQVATLAGTDPEDGALGTGKHFKILTLPTNGKLYYNGIEITTAGFEIISYDPTLLKVDPNDGALTVSFTYAAIDAANQVDPTPATVSMPFTATAAGSDLTLAKTHTGNFTVGTPGIYALTVNNIGSAATTGTITVADILPVGLTIPNGTVMLTGTNAANWSCSATGNAILCTSTTAIAASGNSTFNLNGIQVGVTAVPSVTNTAIVSGGGETNTANNSASDLTTVNIVPDLTLSKTHTGNFTVGMPGTYALTVNNIGSAATTGATTVIDILPVGLTIPNGSVNLTGTNAANWSCTAIGNAITCTSTTTISANGNSTFNLPGIQVGATAVPFITNTATVSGGGETNLANDGASDLTTVSGAAVPDLTLSKTHTGNFSVGTSGIYDLSVNNIGLATTTGIITVTDILPTGLTIPNGSVSLTGTDAANWSCSATSNVITCNTSTPIAASGNSTFNLVGIQVGATAVPSVTNTATVSGGGEVDTANNSASDATAVTDATGVSQPNVLLVKRITAVNGIITNGNVTLNIYDPDPTYPYDKNAIQVGLNPASSDKWPNTTGATSSTFLIGARDGGATQTNDEVEYTIYFLSAGTGPAKNVTLCDRIPRYQTFVPDTFNSLTVAPNTTPVLPIGDRGIEVSQGGTNYGYTNIGDGDAARYYPPGSTLPSACTQPPLPEDNGAIVVLLGDVPDATSAGSPVESYGFFRFRARVK